MNKYTIHLIFFFLTTCLFSCGSAAAETPGYGISLGYGDANSNINVYRVGLQKDFKKKWFVSEIGYLSGYFELSYSYWEDSDDSLNVFALSPVFAYFFGDQTSDFRPYIEAGIGGSYIDETVLGTRDFGSNFQFEDRIGVGLKYRSIDLNFRYMHYSNASLESPNKGIDIFMATAALHF